MSERKLNRAAADRLRRDAQALVDGKVPKKKLTVTITKTRDGLSEYVQIMSEDQTTVNVVLIADRIELHDGRLELDGDD